MNPTPCPGNPGCCCPSCFGLPEYMKRVTEQEEREFDELERMMRDNGPLPGFYD